MSQFQPGLSIAVSWLNSTYSSLTNAELRKRLQELRFSSEGDRATLVGRLVRNDYLTSTTRSSTSTHTWGIGAVGLALIPTDPSSLPPSDASDYAIERELLNSDYSFLTHLELQQRCQRRQLPSTGDKASMIRRLLYHDTQISPIARTFFFRPLLAEEYRELFKKADLREICHSNGLDYSGTCRDLANRLAEKEGLVWNGILMSSRS